VSDFDFDSEEDEGLFDSDGDYIGEHTSLSALYCIRDSVLRGSDRHVLTALVLRSSPHNDGWYCWPTLATLAADASVSKSTLLGAISRLERWEFIATQRGGPRAVNHYRLNMAYIHRLRVRPAIQEARVKRQRRHR